MCTGLPSPFFLSVSTDFLFLLFHQELNKYRAKCSMLFHYDWISIPLVYTQVTASHLPVPVPTVCPVLCVTLRTRDGTCPGAVQSSETLNSQGLILKASLGPH